jgi:hypothetical protein
MTYIDTQHVYETLHELGHTTADYGHLLNTIEDHIGALHYRLNELSGSEMDKLDKLESARDVLPGVGGSTRQFNAAAESWELYRHMSGIRSYTEIAAEVAHIEPRDFDKAAPLYAEASRYFPESRLAQQWERLLTHLDKDCLATEKVREATFSFSAPSREHTKEP